MKEKVVLAYSGGLDTTAIIPWLKENFDYDAVIEWHEDVYKCALNRKNEKRWEQNC